MKTNPNEKLLLDVLNDACEGIREELRQASLRTLRRRRRIQKVRSRLSLAIAAALVICIGVLFVSWEHRTRQEARIRLPVAVRTPPDPAPAPLEMATGLGPGIAIVESRQYPSVVVETASVQQPVEILGDSELLALFQDKPAGLIADSNGAVQLVLFDPRDQTLAQ